MRWFIVAALLCLTAWSVGRLEEGEVEDYTHELEPAPMPYSEGGKTMLWSPDSIRMYPAYLRIPTDSWLMVEMMRIDCEKILTGWYPDSMLAASWLDFWAKKTKWVYGYRGIYEPFCDTIIDTVWIRGIE